MKVRMMMPQAGIQAGVRVIGRDGKPVEVSHIEVDPIFYRRNENPPLAFLEVLHGGKVLSRAMLTISGTTGHLMLRQRQKPVKSKFELAMEEESKQSGDSRTS